ncbi:DNA binding protein [Chifec microvirus UA13_19]|nr:DNA binding protein [Chifec microvirus UA13_19]
MAFRKSANRRSDKRRFSRTASKTHRRNISSRPMRGGIRL